MVTPLRRRLRKLRFAVVACLASAIILVAVVVGLMRLALPWLADNPARVADWLSQRLGRSVSVGHVSELWTRAGPRLLLDNLAIAGGPGGEAPLNLARAEIALNLYAPFQRNRAWNEFRLVGLDLVLERDAGGTWQVRGIDTSGSGAGNGSMGALGAVVLVDLKLAVRDASRDLDLHFAIPELRVLNRGRSTRVLGRIGFADSSSPLLAMVADIDLRARSGSGYVGGRDLDLAEVGAGRAVGGISVPSGRGDIELWASWSAGRMDAISARIGLRETTLVATSTVAADPVLAVTPRAAYEQLSFVARWQRSGEDWSFDLADGAMARRGVSSTGARVHVDRVGGDQAQYRVAASGIELEPLGSLAMLVSGVPAGLRDWLYSANPQGTVAAVAFEWARAMISASRRARRFAVHDARRLERANACALRGDASADLERRPSARIEFRRVQRHSIHALRWGKSLLARICVALQTAQIGSEASDTDRLRGAEGERDGSSRCSTVCTGTKATVRGESVRRNADVAQDSTADVRSSRARSSRGASCSTAISMIGRSTIPKDASRRAPICRDSISIICPIGRAASNSM